MRGMILLVALATSATPARAEPLVDKPVKAAFVTSKDIAPTSQCIAKELDWYGPAIMVPAPAGAQRLQFAFWSKSKTDILITPGTPNRIEVRGIAMKKIKTSISRCL